MPLFSFYGNQDDDALVLGSIIGQCNARLVSTYSLKGPTPVVFKTVAAAARHLKGRADILVTLPDALPDIRFRHIKPREGRPFYSIDDTYDTPLISLGVPRAYQEDDQWYMNPGALDLSPRGWNEAAQHYVPAKPEAKELFQDVKRCIRSVLIKHRKKWLFTPNGLEFLKTYHALFNDHGMWTDYDGRAVKRWNEGQTGKPMMIDLSAPNADELMAEMRRQIEAEHARIKPWPLR